MQIKISDVLGMLNNGNTRKEIQEHYGLNGVEVKTLFSHPELKGKKTKKKKELSFIIVNDVTGQEAPTPTEENTDTEEETPVAEALPEVEEEPKTAWE